MFSCLILHPFELLKVRLAATSENSHPSYQKQSLFRVTKMIYLNEGFSAFYKGVAPNLIGSSLAWGLYFMLYNVLKSDISYLSSDDPSSVKRDNVYSSFVSACGAGVITLLATNPFWVAKTRLCLQTSEKNTKVEHYRGLLHTLTLIYQREGIKGLYKGFVPGLLNISHGAIYFSVYDSMKASYLSHENLPTAAKIPNVVYILLSSSSKIITSFLTYPIILIKLRLQSQFSTYSGTLDAVSRTFATEGIIGFYKGLLPHTLRVTPATVITFLVYENVINFLKR